MAASSIRVPATFRVGELGLGCLEMGRLLSKSQDTADAVVRRWAATCLFLCLAGWFSLLAC